MDAKALYSSEPAKGWLPWSGLAPFLMVLFVAAPMIPSSLALERLGLADAKGDPVGLPGLLVVLLLDFPLALAMALAWVRFVERRPLATLGLTVPGGARTFLRGAAVGLAMILALVAAIGLAGGLAPGGIGPAFASPRALVNIGLLLIGFAVQASVEEVLFRGWLLSVIARRSNDALAVALTCLVFTFLHYGRHQPGLVTLGVFMFSLFTCCWALRAGNIWGVMGWHTGWNWLLAVGFELPVTGIDAHVPALVVRLVPRGSDVLTGGTRGPEGSLLCSLLLAAGCALVMWRIPDRHPKGAAGAGEDGAEVG